MIQCNHRLVHLIFSFTMDKLFPETIGHICSFLQTRDLVTCRLICRSFKCEVDRQLAKVTHVKINEDRLDQTFIPEALYPGLVSCNFECNAKNFEGLFSFLETKCPNIRVLSGHKNTITLDQLLKVSQNLVYFEVATVICPKDRQAEELWPLFPRLEANFLAKRPLVFCTTAWSNRNHVPDLGLSKFTQARNICCRVFMHSGNIENLSIPSDTSWYSAELYFDYSDDEDDYSEESIEAQTSVLQEQLASVATSLRFLKLSIDEISFQFYLPNLLWVHLHFGGEGSNKAFTSLKHSTNLKVLNMRFRENADFEEDDLSSLIASLEHLTSLCLCMDLTEQLIALTLPPKLIYLNLYGLGLMDETFSTSVKFLVLKDSNSRFCFPNLLEFSFECINCIPEKYPESNIISLAHSTKLTRLELKPSSSKFKIAPVASTLRSMTKIETIKFETLYTFTPFTLHVARHPHLRYFQWQEFEYSRKTKVNIRLDGKYEWVDYNSEDEFILAPKQGHPIQFSISSPKKLHFEHELKDTVTRATFVVPSKSPLFELSQLLECKVIISEAKEGVVEAVCSSLLHSPKLQVLTIISSRLALSQLVLLLWSLNKLPDLRELNGTVHFEKPNWPFDFNCEFCKFSSLSRVHCNWQLICLSDE